MTHRISLLLASAITVLLTASACALPDVDHPHAQLSISPPSVASLLGERLEFDDRMGTAQVARLSTPMDIEGVREFDYEAGDVAYWPDGRSVIVFLSEGRAVPDGGVVLIGKVTNGMDVLTGCASDCVATIDTAPTSDGGAA
ncbi:hypothetical protein HD599_000517 [Conyzicola lurida]|uniref:Cyclophilin-like domain-containing protein n=1 Tax=Conyzicola lurida TaxID=1172621 RepID=A0A841AIC4_9MICO|nr:cyclophilin-like fold protein [Conyzicola lurida]MBB5842194.1 hypothetical protein [Conyzicola lurida]